MRTYDLIVLGAGSGNSLIGPELADRKTAIVEPDVFGGTCLNRGCIPTKMFVVAADAVSTARGSHRLGVTSHVDRVDWPAVRDRVFGRIDPIPPSGLAYRRTTSDVFEGRGRFVAPKVIEIDGGPDHGQRITAEQIVIGVGARPVLPEIDGLADVPFHTSDSIMRIDAVPASMLIVGGGFIATEMAHVFEAFGSRITIVQRAPRLLPGEDVELGERFTEIARERFDVRLRSHVIAVERTPSGGVRALVRGLDGDTHVEADCLLLAAGRVPNSDTLDVEAGGIEVDGHGHIKVDEHLQTAVPGVWAFGDVQNHWQLKHMANAQGRVIAHNILHPDDLRAGPGDDIVPHAVFSEPQVAAVGLTEEQVVARGLPHVISRRPYADVAYGWALEDTTGFVKLVADPETRLLLGAHIMGAQAATLLQPLVQGMTYGQTVEQMASVIYIHPALTEVVENALLDLP